MSIFMVFEKKKIGRNVTFLLYFEKFVEKCYMLLYTFLEVI